MDLLRLDNLTATKTVLLNPKGYGEDPVLYPWISHPKIIMLFLKRPSNTIMGRVTFYGQYMPNQAPLDDSNIRFIQILSYLIQLPLITFDIC